MDCFTALFRVAAVLECLRGPEFNNEPFGQDTKGLRDIRILLPAVLHAASVASLKCLLQIFLTPAPNRLRAS